MENRIAYYWNLLWYTGTMYEIIDQYFAENLKIEKRKDAYKAFWVDWTELVYSVNWTTKTVPLSKILTRMIEFFISKNNLTIFSVLWNNELEDKINHFPEKHYWEKVEIENWVIKYKKMWTENEFNAYYIWLPWDDVFLEKARALKIAPNDTGKELKEIYERLFVRNIDESVKEKISKELSLIETQSTSIAFEWYDCVIKTKDITMSWACAPQEIWKFDIHIDLFKKDFSVRVYKPTFNGKNLCQHPHVNSSGGLCTGSFSSTLTECWKTKDLLVIYTIMVEFLSSFWTNPFLELKSYLSNLKKYGIN